MAMTDPEIKRSWKCTCGADFDSHRKADGSILERIRKRQAAGEQHDPIMHFSANRAERRARARR